MKCTCSNIQPHGTFKTRPNEKPPLKPFRVQSSREDETIYFGDFDSIEMARAGACGIENVEILTRE